MNSEYIHTLLNKYWRCETSAREEQELRDFFSGTEVPRELVRYVPLFAYLNEERSITPGSDFDDRLKAAIKKSEREQQYITIRIFAPVLRIAASLLLVLGLGISVYFISKQYNKPYFAETYHDPNAAIKDATYALIKVSNALQSSEEASMQTIQLIDELEIDWSSLDSLSSTLQEVPEKEADTKDMSLDKDSNDTGEEIKEAFWQEEGDL